MPGPHPDPPPPAVRQPFTWRGVAALAVRPAGWLAAWCLVTAALLGGAAARFYAVAWQPALDAAVRQLPSTGEIHDGRLVWPTNTATELVRTRHLALRVNPLAAPVPGQAADVEIELLSGELSMQSLLGYWVVRYPTGWVVALNRPEVEPLWRTWQPYLPALVGAGVAVSVLGMWFAIGLVAAPVLRLGTALLRRDITLGGCWRLSVAALLAGGWIVAGGLVLYAEHGFRLLDWLVAFALAHAVDLILWLGAPWCLPRRARPGPFGNMPAGAEPAPGDSPFAAPAAFALDNPFAAPAGRRGEKAEPSPLSAPPSLPVAPEPSEPSEEQPLNPS